MKLIILIVIAVAADQFDDALGGILAKFKNLRKWDWLHQGAAALEKSLGGMGIWNGPVGVLATALLPVVIIWFAYAVISKPLFGLFGLLVSVAILIYSMGPKDLLPQLKNVAAALSGNASDAEQQVQGLSGSSAPVAADTRARVTVESAMVAANERAFAPICWFAVLNWPGALLYRLVSELRNYKGASDAFSNGAKQVHAVLAWLPARLTALAYIISGNISNGFKNWRLLDTLGLGSNDEAIKSAGMGALETTGSDSDQVAAVTAMLQKALFVFIGILAVLKIVFWFI
jgi:AmpE protein